MRLLFLGVDCLGLSWFERIWRPRLPETMHWGELHAPVAMTGPSWTSIFTGLPVAEHGVTDLFGLARGTSKTFADLPGAYIWEGLPGPTGVFNVPATYPPRGRQGDWMVSGYPNKPACAPRGLLDGVDYVSDFASVAGRLQRDRGRERPFWPDEMDFPTAYRLMCWIAELRLWAVKQLSQPEYLFMVNTVFDRVAHAKHGAANPPANPFDEAASFILEWVLRAIDWFKPWMVVVASDHGWDESRPDHDSHGCYALWHKGTRGGRRDLENYELRALVEGHLQANDPTVDERLRALGYV